MHLIQFVYTNNFRPLFFQDIQDSVRGIRAVEIYSVLSNVTYSSGIVANGGTDGIVANGNNGYGGSFKGTLAPLKLEPSGAAGSPTTSAHAVGELYVDVNGVLYFCTANGTPGTWKTVQLV
ncbi:MAG: hypothetical protein WBZ36_18050 [Candidatus Nitrosopolaris sp.]